MKYREEAPYKHSAEERQKYADHIKVLERLEELFEERCDAIKEFNKLHDRVFGLECKIILAKRRMHNGGKMSDESYIKNSLQSPK